MSRRRLPGLDTALDRTVLPGWSALGYRLRRRTWDPDDPAPASLDGKVVVVTGAGSGLGAAAATATARLGAHVHLVVRDLAKGAAAASRLRAEVPGARVEVHRCDVADLASVRAFATVLRGSVDAVDALVHNAGTMPPERTETADGHESAFATHVLGPVLMTELLRPALASAGQSRVILVSSGGMYAQRLPVADPEFRIGTYGGTAAYARTKRMQVALAPLMQERWAADGVAVHTMHPGWVDTPGVASSMPRFHTVMRPLLRDVAAGADTVVWLAATRPPPGGGLFWQDREPRPEHVLPTTRGHRGDAEQVWAHVLEATGLTWTPGTGGVRGLRRCRSPR